MMPVVSLRLDLGDEEGHHGGMPNYHPKGVEYMRTLARRGGLESGETRRLKRVRRILEQRAFQKFGIAPPPLMDRRTALVHEVWEGTGRRFTLEQIAKAMRPVDRRGGSHDTDWRCPYCRHANSIKQRSCAKCFKSPANGRMTRAARRERAAEHRTQAILRKHGLQ
jgi:hypothetical protein